MSTTDFESWLDQADPESAEQAYALYEAVSSEEGDGIWNVVENNGRLIVSCGHVDEKLIIASEQAKAVFLNMLREKHMDDTDDVESWYGFQRNMDNPKA